MLQPHTLPALQGCWAGWRAGAGACRAPEYILLPHPHPWGSKGFTQQCSQPPPPSNCPLPCLWPALTSKVLQALASNVPSKLWNLGSQHSTW